MTLRWLFPLAALLLALPLLPPVRASNNDDAIYAENADGIPTTILIEGDRTSGMAKAMKGTVPDEEAGFLKSIMNWISSFFYEVDGHEKDPGVRKQIVDTQMNYNRDIANRAATAYLLSGQTEPGGIKGATRCLDGTSLLKPASGERRRGDASGWVEDTNADKRTFTVGATQLGGPKDLTLFKQPRGGRMRKAPNTSSYDSNEWVPRGMKKRACEFALPGFVPKGVDVLFRRKGSKKAFRAERGDTGPMRTHDQYWKTLKETKEAFAKLTAKEQAKIKASDRTIAEANSGLRGDPTRGKVPKPVAPIGHPDPAFPMRGMDLTEGCWDQMQEQGIITAEERKSGWAMIEWQFAPAPPDRKPETDRPQPHWNTSTDENGKPAQFLNIEESSRPWGGNGRWGWWGESPDQSAPPVSSAGKRTTPATPPVIQSVPVAPQGPPVRRAVTPIAAQPAAGVRLPAQVRPPTVQRATPQTTSGGAALKQFNLNGP